LKSSYTVLEIKYQETCMTFGWITCW